MKPVFHLYKNFPRIDVVRSAKGHAVVEQESAIRDVESAYSHGKPLTKILSHGYVECGVAWKVMGLSSPFTNPDP